MHASGSWTPKPHAFRRTVSLASASITVAALLGYLAHHIGPLEEHATENILLGLLVTLVAVSVGAAIIAPKHHLPEVVVARPGADRIGITTAADLGFCAALHAVALPHGFFVKLGSRFLRAYHRTFIESPYAVSFVATINGVPVGFLAGVLRPQAHVRWTLRHRGLRLATEGAIALIARPLTAVRFLRTRVGRYREGWRRNRAPRIPTSEPRRQMAVLSHVAVLPGVRGTGAGRRLTTAFVDACRADGAAGATLVTLDAPDGASGFYATLGWLPGEVRTTADGQSMVEWTHPCRLEHES